MSNLQTYYHFKLDFQKWTNIQEVTEIKKAGINGTTFLK